MLLVDWFARLARECGLPVAQYGTSNQAFTLGAPDAFNVTAHFVDERPFLRFVSSDAARQELVESVAQQAVKRVDAGDFGDTVWHSSALSEVCFQLSPPFSMGPLLQQLGSQTRILGWRRLGADILIEFTEELPTDWDEKKALFAPTSIATSMLRFRGLVPGTSLLTLCTELWRQWLQSARSRWAAESSSLLQYSPPSPNNYLVSMSAALIQACSPLRARVHLLTYSA
jgi:hypothetical protein